MITNAKDRKLSEVSSALPDVSPSVNSFLQPVTLQIIKKQSIAGRVQELARDVKTLAARQPFNSQQLKQRPEGQRQWKWEMIHITPEIRLRPDDRIVWNGTPYRIMERFDWSEYGFVLYHAYQDFVKLGTAT